MIITRADHKTAVDNAREFLIRNHWNENMENSLVPLWQKHLGIELVLVEPSRSAYGLKFRDEEHLTAFLLRWT